MALYDTAANIINDAAVECGLAEASDVFASTNQNFVQLRRLLKTSGRALTLRRSWRHLTKEYTFTTDGSSSYALPADFSEMIDQSGWDRTARYPLGGPMSASEWQWLKAQQSGFYLNVLFRPFESTIELWPQPVVSGAEIAFEYASRYWVMTNGQTSPDKDAPTANSDVIKFVALLAVRALKLAFLSAKGLDTTTALDDYSEAIGLVESANEGAAPILSLDGPSPDEKLIDMSNAPATGYGFDGGGLF